MVDTEFHIKGLDKLILKYNGLTGAQLQNEMIKTTQKAVNYVHGEVPPYPAPPPLSTYRRTGTLGRRINTDVKTVGSQIVGVIGSPTVYSPWVISSERVPAGTGPQAKVHQGRWYVLQDVVKGASKTVVGFFDDMIKSLLKR